MLVLRTSTDRERQSLLAGMDGLWDGLTVSTTTGWGNGSPVLRRVMRRMEVSDTIAWGLCCLVGKRNKGRIKYGTEVWKGTNWSLLASMLRILRGRIQISMHGNGEEILRNWKYRRKPCPNRQEYEAPR
jgi:hypothetical protein